VVLLVGHEGKSTAPIKKDGTAGLLPGEIGTEKASADEVVALGSGEVAEGFEGKLGLAGGLKDKGLGGTEFLTA
jgi:hypothetical protein